MPTGQHETRKWFALGLAAVLAWVAFLAILGPGERGAGPEPPTLVGTGLVGAADFGWTLLDLDGAPVDFARFRGRPILLNLWATWCGPCLVEMPSLARLASDPRIKAKDIAVVCASVDRSPEALREFVKGKPWGMTVLRATSVPPVFQTEGIPATFLIAPDGRIVASEVGSARWDDPSVVAFLEKLAAPPR
jgi:thiol-disulfide isomerase/thioredoxin